MQMHRDEGIEQGDWPLDTDQMMQMHEFGLPVTVENVGLVDALGEAADPEDFEGIFGAMSFDGGYECLECVVAH